MPLAGEKMSGETQSAVDTPLIEAGGEAEDKLQAARKEAAALLEKASREAKAQLDQAASQAQYALEEAKSQGYQEGYREGNQQGQELHRQNTEEAGRQLNRLLSEIAGERQAFIDSFEGEMVELAVSIAEKIVVSAINKDDNAFKSMIINALKHMRRESKITLHVSEEQYNEFFKAESANFVLGDETITVVIVNDTQLENGDLILESDEETVNAGVGSQLKHIMLAFGQPGGGEG
jgi:flagellar assembly protein FliH